MRRFLIAVLAIGLVSIFSLAGGGLGASGKAGASIPAPLLARHLKLSECVPPDDPSMPPSGAFFQGRLDRETEVWGILCEPSAYNFPYAVYLVRNRAYDEAERLTFADYDVTTGWTGTDVLFNVSFDARRKELRAFSKSRGLGDCGSKSILRWEGDRFALKEFRYKDRCDGKLENPFPLIYKRQPAGRR